MFTKAIALLKGCLRNDSGRIDSLFIFPSSTQQDPSPQHGTNQRISLSSRNNTPLGERSRNLRSASKSFRTLWLVVTGLVGGFSSFVIYDRFYHAVAFTPVELLSVPIEQVEKALETNPELSMSGIMILNPKQKSS